MKLMISAFQKFNNQAHVHTVIKTLTAAHCSYAEMGEVLDEAITEIVDYTSSNTSLLATSEWFDALDIQLRFNPSAQDIELNDTAIRRMEEGK